MKVFHSYNVDGILYELAWQELNGKPVLRSESLDGGQRLSMLLHKDIPFDPQVGVSSIPPAVLSDIQHRVREATQDVLRRISWEQRGCPRPRGR